MTKRKRFLTPTPGRTAMSPFSKERGSRQRRNTGKKLCPFLKKLIGTLNLRRIGNYDTDVA